MRCFQAIPILLLSAALQGCSGLSYPGLEQARTSQKPIFVGAIGTSKPSQDGFMSAQIDFFNTSGNTYKYVDFDVRAYNRFGDPVINPGDPGPDVRLRFTGPLPPRRTPGMTIWPRTWRTVIVACVEISRIEISHMDGTNRTLDSLELTGSLSASLRSGCGTTQASTPEPGLQLTKQKSD